MAIPEVSDTYTCSVCGGVREGTFEPKTNPDGSREITLPWCGAGHDPAVMYGRHFPAPTRRPPFDRPDSRTREDRDEARREHLEAHG